MARSSTTRSSHMASASPLTSSIPAPSIPSAPPARVGSASAVAVSLVVDAAAKAATAVTDLRRGLGPPPRDDLRNTARNVEPGLRPPTGLLRAPPCMPCASASANTELPFFQHVCPALTVLPLGLKTLFPSGVLTTLTSDSLEIVLSRDARLCPSPCTSFSALDKPPLKSTSSTYDMRAALFEDMVTTGFALWCNRT